MGEFGTSANELYRPTVDRAATQPIIEIPTLYLNNRNVETLGWYFSDSPRAQLYQQRGAAVGHIAIKGTDGRQLSNGSGVFISEDGYMVTKYHVIKNAPDGGIEVTANGRTHRATVVGTDPATDMAMLRVQPQDGERFQAARISERDAGPGSQLVALGFPKDSNRLHMSPGTFNTETTLDALRLRRGPGSGENLQRPVMVADMNVQTGNSGGAAFELETGDVAGLVAMTDEGRLGVMTPARDVLAFINRTRRELPSTTSNSYVNTALGYLPDNWRRNIASYLGGTAIPDHSQYTRRDTGERSWDMDYIRSYIANWSFSKLFS